MTGFDVAMLRKGLEWAKAEYEATKGTHALVAATREERHTWYQRNWGSVVLNALWRSHSRETNNNNFKAVNPMTCGSTGCLAGHICAINGDDYAIPYHAQTGDHYVIDYVVDAEGNIRKVKNRAMELLGVTEQEADMLFDGKNGIQTLEETCRFVARRHGEEL